MSIPKDLSEVDIKKGVHKVVLSKELRGSYLGVNMPDTYDSGVVTSLEWNDSREDRIGWT